MSTSDSYPTLTPAIITGFAATVCMWTVGFATHLPGVRPDTQFEKMLVGIAFLVTMVVSAAVGARACGVLGRMALLRYGAFTGLATGVLNLGVLGSVLTEPAAKGSGAAAVVRPDAGIAVLGFLVASIVLCSLGAFASRLLPRRRTPLTAGSWLGVMGVVAALAIVPVLLTGGLVTSNEAGLAVPDWPTSFEANMFLFPLSKMTGGIYYEHTHRLFGSLAGIGTIGLLLTSILVWRNGSREAVSRLGLRAAKFALVAGCAVALQGYLGGVRVSSADDPMTQTDWSLSEQADVIAEQGNASNFALTQDDNQSLSLAMLHGISGQLTFALLCVFAAMIAPRWTETDRDRADARSLKIRTISVLAFGSLVVQLSLGAALRHLHSSHAMISHIGFSVVAVLLVFFASAFALRLSKASRDSGPLRFFAKAVLGLICLQFAIGWVALAVVVPEYDNTGEEPAFAVLVATAHQAIGALLLGSTASMVAWTFRFTRRGLHADLPPVRAEPAM